MARTWANDGKPGPDGRLCLVIDPEDGTQPLRVWGRSREEILEKAAKTVEHGARTITSLRSQLTPSNGTPAKPNGAPAAEPPKQPAKLSPGERMRFTADLANPSKAPEAVTRLVEHHTGLNLTELAKHDLVEKIAMIQAQWSYNHPDFPKHPTNYRLLNDAAALRVGYENITAEVMDQVYAELSAQGLFVPAEEDEPPAPTVPPGETPELRTVRPRGAASFRRSEFSRPAPAAASPQAKYTKAQIDAMPSAEYRRKLETDPDFAAAVSALASPSVQ